MTKRTYAIVLIAAVVLVVAAIAMKQHGGGAPMHWLSAIHGRR
jgi:hypothetical protein